MHNRGLTPAAMRALDGAGRLAWTAGGAEVETSHLLWSLVLDESRAAQLLQHAMIRAEMLDAVFPFLGNQQALLEESSDKTSFAISYEPPPIPMPLSPAVSAVLVEARTILARLGSEPEVGSEHLLAALAVVDVSIGEFFERFGLGPAGLAQKVAETAGFVTEPIAPEFNIRWSEPTEADHTDTLRTLDAAANRCREGLRVVEDFVRFSLDDAHLSRLLKELRHELTERLSDLDRLGVISARDTLGDVGTRIKTSREQTRQRPSDIVLANCRRVAEAFRTLEEFSKFVITKLADPTLPSRLEQMRYRLYTIEKALLTTLSSRDRLEGCDLYLLATEALCHHGIGPAVRQALEAGIGIVQLREKDLTDRRSLELAHRVREWTREANALFIMNDRADLAVLSDADGVHVGQEELTVREARRIVGANRLVGVSTHTVEQARQAVLDGADYIGVGPVFSTTTKSFDQLVGLEFVQQVANEIKLPWFAIGGISLENISAVRSAGATQVAVSSAICSSPNPGRAAAELLDRMRMF
ncbi:MAG: thiamine phosphate synthase [Planctomycetia bacterium]|nr:thiamine phosphate synthase [Planctomycetia bacterium]